jgi:hypothetical protein
MNLDHDVVLTQLWLRHLAKSQSAAFLVAIDQE